MHHRFNLALMGLLVLGDNRVRGAPGVNPKPRPTPAFHRRPARPSSNARAKHRVANWRNGKRPGHRPSTDWATMGSRDGLTYPPVPTCRAGRSPSPAAPAEDFVEERMGFGFAYSGMTAAALIAGQEPSPASYSTANLRSSGAVRVGENSAIGWQLRSQNSNLVLAEPSSGAMRLASEGWAAVGQVSAPIAGDPRLRPYALVDATGSVLTCARTEPPPTRCRCRPARRTLIGGYPRDLDTLLNRGGIRILRWRERGAG